MKIVYGVSLSQIEFVNYIGLILIVIQIEIWKRNVNSKIWLPTTTETQNILTEKILS